MAKTRTDAELLACFPAADALDELYSRHVDAVFGFAVRRCRDADDVADVHDPVLAMVRRSPRLAIAGHRTLRSSAAQFRAWYPPPLHRTNDVTPEPNNLSHQEVKIGASRAMVVDRDSQAVLTADGCVGNGSDAVLLQPQHDFDIETFQRGLIEAWRTIAKANNVDGRSRDPFEEWL